MHVLGPHERNLPDPVPNEEPREVLQSPQFWPIPTRTTVQNRCTTAIHPAGYDLSTNQKLCGL